MTPADAVSTMPIKQAGPAAPQMNESRATTDVLHIHMPPTDSSLGSGYYDRTCEGLSGICLPFQRLAVNEVVLGTRIRDQDPSERGMKNEGVGVMLSTQVVLENFSARPARVNV